MFVIEDELHDEWIDTYDHQDEATAALRRFAALPWDQSPNKAPCTSWRDCGRSYELVEYDTTETPWRELSREAILDISDGDRAALAFGVVEQLPADRAAGVFAVEA